MKRLILTTCLCVLFASCTALADWDVGEPYKMHFPQMPDLDGWDVAFNTELVPQLADDWRCTESGYVDDVHIWYSWKGDSNGIIDKVQLGIWSNSKDPDGDGPLYSTPKDLVWEYQGDFTTHPWGPEGTGGKQGWYDPVSDVNIPSDHYQIYQLNIEDITDPFPQVKDEIYWLSVCFWMGEDPNSPGWKTADVEQYPDPWTGEHFMDDAVFWKDGIWHELKSPLAPYESLDLAFVITPEPATISLLGLGSLVLLRKRRA